MNWIATPESSAFFGFGYTEATRVLTIQFRQGRAYDYYEVPESVVEKVKAAPSRGRFFAENVRDAYRFARVSRK